MNQLAVNILCRNPHEDRVIPRFSRYLADHLGWMLTAVPVKDADVYHLSCYIEKNLLGQIRPGDGKPIAAYFTHRETDRASITKTKLFDRLAEQVDLRIATAAMYAETLSAHGYTMQIPPPVERERFVIPARPPGRNGIVAGLSGYTYSNRRKGEDLARILVTSKTGRSLTWRASGRGWPVRSIRYTWSEMPAYYQSLDVLVVTSRVEGVPMPPLEALACGVSVVIPRGVGLLDELPDRDGIHRYRRGDAGDLKRAVDEATRMRGDVDREALRGATAPYTIDAWCRGHARAIAGLASEETMLDSILTATDEKILAAVRLAWPEVDAVLAWTGRHIPYIKRQIAAYQGAVLAYYAHYYNRPGSRFLEIGTALGYSACLMATAAPQATVTTLNPKPGEYERATDNLEIRSTVRVIQKTSQEFWDEGIAELYDLIFVDGDHAYNMVLHDSQFFNRLRSGGLILFHDYSPDGSDRPSDGSYRALNDLQTSRRPADVKIIGSGNVGMLGWLRQEGETWPQP